MDSRSSQIIDHQHNTVLAQFLLNRQSYRYAPQHHLTQYLPHRPQAAAAQQHAHRHRCCNASQAGASQPSLSGATVAAQYRLNCIIAGPKVQLQLHEFQLHEVGCRSLIPRQARLLRQAG